jgi:hypothetical protein
MCNKLDRKAPTAAGAARLRFARRAEAPRYLMPHGGILRPVPLSSFSAPACFKSTAEAI